MSNESGFLNFSLRLLGVEIVAVHLQVDDFKTKWALIALATGTLSVVAIPYIQEIIHG
jgi:hypothetical protein